MAYHKAVSELMSFSINSYYMWKKENRPIISLLQKYLTEDDIYEFLNTGNISKFDNIKFTKNEIFKDYFDFIIDLKDEELHLFLSVVKENQNDLLHLSQNFIEIILNYDCENRYKIKLIENYSKINDKNKLFHFGLNIMLQDKFRDFYSFSFEYSRLDKKYTLGIKHIKLYFQIFEEKKIKDMDEYFPELKSQEFLMSPEYRNDFAYLDYDKKYYQKLLELF